MTSRPANLPHRLDRSLTIQARRETVFRFFTDPVRWASWWGAGSTIDPRPGGRIVITFPGGVEVTGEVIEIATPDRLTFTYGFASGTPIAPGASLVTIRLEATGVSGRDTRLHLSHEFSDAAIRDVHVQGWRYQLSIFANIVSDEVQADATATIDTWLEAWSEANAAARTAMLGRIADPTVRFRDRFSAVDGLDDLHAHLEAAQRFMPGLRLHRDGVVRQCQGVALADWIAHSADGQERARGTNVFTLNSGGRIESVTGLWSQHPQRSEKGVAHA
jgi:uncharacterized protein YndB with AHSA1/START domain